eukprot:scaffold71848_cov63-Phaeocystis_antarctica.AAC.2
MSLEHRPRALVRGGGELCAAAHHEAMIELCQAPPFRPPWNFRLSNSSSRKTQVEISLDSRPGPPALAPLTPDPR